MCSVILEKHDVVAIFEKNIQRKISCRKKEKGFLLLVAAHVYYKCIGGEKNFKMLFVLI